MHPHTRARIVFPVTFIWYIRVVLYWNRTVLVRVQSCSHNRDLLVARHGVEITSHFIISLQLSSNKLENCYTRLPANCND